MWIRLATEQTAVELQLTQCCNTVQQEGATKKRNQMQIKPYRQTRNNTHIYHFYIEQKSYFKQHSARLPEH